MTTSQALRYERRRQQALQEQRARQALREAIIGMLVTLILIALFSIVGTMDYQDEQREIAYWESQGIHIARDW